MRRQAAIHNAAFFSTRQAGMLPGETRVYQACVRLEAWQGLNGPAHHHPGGAPPAQLAASAFAPAAPHESHQYGATAESLPLSIWCGHACRRPHLQLAPQGKMFQLKRLLSGMRLQVGVLGRAGWPAAVLRQGTLVLTVAAVDSTIEGWRWCQRRCWRRVVACQVDHHLSRPRCGLRSLPRPFARVLLLRHGCFRSCAASKE